jgi:hypothetical protein
MPNWIEIRAGPAASGSTHRAARRRTPAIERWRVARPGLDRALHPDVKLLAQPSSELWFVGLTTIDANAEHMCRAQGRFNGRARQVTHRIICWRSQENLDRGPTPCARSGPAG